MRHWPSRESTPLQETAGTFAFLPARLLILSLSIWEQPLIPLTSALVRAAEY